MTRPAPPKAKDVEQVLSIARALEAEGYQAGSVQVAADGSWSLSWAKALGQVGQGSPLEQWRANRGAS
jgi:hypothetical protein